MFFKYNKFLDFGRGLTNEPFIRLVCIFTGVKLKANIPILHWLPAYPGRQLKYDVLAGITVAVILIPQGMAYSMLAGLPPIYGLYGGLVPLLLYAMMGSSKYLSVGPTALVSLLVLTGVGTLEEPGTQSFIELAICVSLFAGLLQIFLGFFKLGFLIHFLAQPVLTGFTSAAAIIIGLSQLKYLMGYSSLERSSSIVVMGAEILQHLSDIHGVTFLFGILSLLFLLLQRRWFRAFPGALLVVIISILIMKWTHLEDQGVMMIGAIPSGLPAFQIPSFSIHDVERAFSPALTICLISFIESLAIGRVLQKKTKSVKIIPNQELLALGVSKIGGSFFQAFPTTGSFTRSVINQESGARSGLSSIVAALFLGLTLLFFTPFFEDLPLSVLAAIILVSVTSLIDWSEAIVLWKSDRTDFWILITTFLSTLLFGVQLGIATGVALSIALMVYRNARPHVAILGRIPDTPHYRNLERFEFALQESDILILRFDAQIYFGNGAYFEDFIQGKVLEHKDQIKLLIIDASNIHDLDSSGMEALKNTLHWLDENQVTCFISNAIGPVRDALSRHGVLNQLGAGSFFLSISDAVDTFRENESQQAKVSQSVLKSSFDDTNKE